MDTLSNQRFLSDDGSSVAVVMEPDDVQVFGSLNLYAGGQCVSVDLSVYPDVTTPAGQAEVRKRLDMLNDISVVLLGASGYLTLLLEAGESDE